MAVSALCNTAEPDDQPSASERIKAAKANHDVANGAGVAIGMREGCGDEAVAEKGHFLALLEAALSRSRRAVAAREKVNLRGY